MSSIGVVPTSQPHIGPGAPNWYQNGQSMSAGFGIGSGGMVQVSEVRKHVVGCECAARSVVGLSLRLAPVDDVRFAEAA